MFEDFATVVGILVKYGTIFFFIVLSIGILHSFLKKLRNEPGKLAKLILVILIPSALAIAVPYFILQEFDTPLWLNILAGFYIYAFTTSFFEKRVNVRFKDEDTNS